MNFVALYLFRLEHCAIMRSVMNIRELPRRGGFSRLRQKVVWTGVTQKRGVSCGAAVSAECRPVAELLVGR